MRKLNWNILHCHPELSRRIVNSLISSVLSVVLFTSCEPETGGSSDPIYENITTLTKKPSVVIDWTDSLWFHYGDNTWESFDLKSSSKKSVNVFGKSNVPYISLLIDNNNIYMASATGFLISINLTTKKYTEESIENILDANVYATDVSLQGGLPTMLSGGNIHVFQNGSWTKQNFNNLKLKSWERMQGYQKFGSFQLFYVWSSYFGLVSHFYIKLPNGSTVNDTLSGIQGVIKFKLHNQNNFSILVLHNEDQSAIKGLLTEDSFIPYPEPYKVERPKIFSGNEYFLSAASASSNKNLSKLYITTNGDIVPERIVYYKDLPSTILDYWIYGKTVYLYLTDKKLVKVKI